MPTVLAYAAEKSDAGGRFHLAGVGLRLQIRKSSTVRYVDADGDSRIGDALGYGGIQLRYYPSISGVDGAAYGVAMDIPVFGHMKLRLEWISTADESSGVQLFGLGFGYANSGSFNLF